MKLYVYGEHTTRGGMVAGHDLPTEDDWMGDGPYQTDDMFEWGEGSEDELAQQARDRLAVRRDTRPGGAGDKFDHRCARSVLRWLGADEAGA